MRTALGGADATSTARAEGAEFIEVTFCEQPLVALIVSGVRLGKSGMWFVGNLLPANGIPVGGSGSDHAPQNRRPRCSLPRQLARQTLPRSPRLDLLSYFLDWHGWFVCQ
jgi:hypothetical protein